VAVRELRLIIPSRLWDKLNDLELRTGVRKEDIVARALVNIVEGVTCPRCGEVIREFE
jgi:hypothetical protein